MTGDRLQGTGKAKTRTTGNRLGRHRLQVTGDRLQGTGEAKTKSTATAPAIAELRENALKSALCDQEFSGSFHFGRRGDLRSG